MRFFLPLCLTFVISSACVLAQTPSVTPAPAASPAVVEPATLPAAVAVATPAPVVSKVQSAVDKIPASLPAWLIAVLGLIVELSMRLFPTVKPRSLFILAGQLFGTIGSGFMKISVLLDDVVQTLKDPDAKT